MIVTAIDGAFPKKDPVRYVVVLSGRARLALIGKYRWDCLVETNTK